MLIQQWMDFDQGRCICIQFHDSHDKLTLTNYTKMGAFVLKCPDNSRFAAVSILDGHWHWLCFMGGFGLEKNRDTSDDSSRGV